MSKPNIFPSIRYKKAGALEWLGKAFGFEKHFVVPGADGHVVHAQLVLGPGMIMVGTGPHDPPGPWDTVTHGVYVHVDDIDAHYARARAAGAEIAMDLKDTSYGSREYSARDLEGNLWSFGTYDPWK